MISIQIWNVTSSITDFLPSLWPQYYQITYEISFVQKPYNSKLVCDGDLKQPKKNGSLPQSLNKNSNLP